jgi:hypothetical protein
MSKEEQVQEIDAFFQYLERDASISAREKLLLLLLPL